MSRIHADPGGKKIGRHAATWRPKEQIAYVVRIPQDRRKINGLYENVDEGKAKVERDCV